MKYFILILINIFLFWLFYSFLIFGLPDDIELARGTAVFMTLFSDLFLIPVVWILGEIYK